MNPWQRGQGMGIGLVFLLADLHDGLDAPVLRTDHLKHPLVFGSPFKECGKIFVVRVLPDGRIAAFPIIDLFMDERGHRLRAIDSHEARHSPKYLPLIGRTLNPLGCDARTQRRSLFDLDTVTFIAELGEAGGWESNHDHGHKYV
jgi:hypothetical protein